jgi:uncharacterized protein (DUF58 family)
VETSDLLKRVRKIEIKTRGLSNHIFAGEYHSAFKGRGMAFSEVREYQYGDDIRNIDWNVTARFNHPYIKVFEEERELTVMLLIDLSDSKEFGSRKMLKRELITELSAVLSFSAIQNNDKIGVIFFSDKIEKYIPPKKGRKHILRIIRDLIELRPESKGTDIALALKYLTNVQKKRTTSFLISDFIDSGFSDAMRIANYKHDLIALHVFDKRECELPNVGLLRLRDAETNRQLWIDTSSKAIRKKYAETWLKAQTELKDIFTRAGVDHANILTDEDYVKPLLKLFKQR